MAFKKSKKKTIIVLVIAILVVVAVVAFANSKSDDGNKTDVVDNTDPVYQVETTISDTASEEMTEADVDSVIAPVEGEEITSESTTLLASEGAPATKGEIIALYNEAANKVKVEAKKVTRNFKNTRYDTSKSILPSALESMANPMIEKYVKDDVEPVDYVTKEDIIENYPAPKQTYSSKLTAADVDEATCVDNGKEYVITLKLASCTNPTAGKKVGAACHIMDVSSIKASDSSMIKKFDAVYDGCVIRCKIDKATNRVTWANFYTPFTIDALINVLFSELKTVAVMSYERDYTVTY